MNTVAIVKAASLCHDIVVNGQTVGYISRCIDEGWTFKSVSDWNCFDITKQSFSYAKDCRQAVTEFWKGFSFPDSSKQEKEQASMNQQEQVEVKQEEDSSLWIAETSEGFGAGKTKAEALRNLNQEIADNAGAGLEVGTEAWHIQQLQENERLFLEGKARLEQEEQDKQANLQEDTSMKEQASNSSFDTTEVSVVVEKAVNKLLEEEGKATPVFQIADATPAYAGKRKQACFLEHGMVGKDFADYIVVIDYLETEVSGNWKRIYISESFDGRYDRRYVGNIVKTFDGNWTYGIQFAEASDTTRLETRTSWDSFTGDYKTRKSALQDMLETLVFLQFNSRNIEEYAVLLNVQPEEQEEEEQDTVWNYIDKPACLKSRYKAIQNEAGEVIYWEEGYVGLSAECLIGDYSLSDCITIVSDFLEEQEEEEEEEQEEGEEQECAEAIADPEGFYGPMAAWTSEEEEEEQEGKQLVTVDQLKAVIYNLSESELERIAQVAYTIEAGLRIWKEEDWYLDCNTPSDFPADKIIGTTVYLEEEKQHKAEVSFICKFTGKEDLLVSYADSALQAIQNVETALLDTGVLADRRRDYIYSLYIHQLKPENAVEGFADRIEARQDYFSNIYQTVGENALSSLEQVESALLALIRIESNRQYCQSIGKDYEAIFCNGFPVSFDSEVVEDWIQSIVYEEGDYTRWSACETTFTFWTQDKEQEDKEEKLEQAMQKAGNLEELQLAIEEADKYLTTLEEVYLWQDYFSNAYPAPSFGELPEAVLEYITQELEFEIVSNDNERVLLQEHGSFWIADARQVVEDNGACWIGLQLEVTPIDTPVTADCFDDKQREVSYAGDTVGYFEYEYASPATYGQSGWKFEQWSNSYNVGWTIQFIDTVEEAERLLREDIHERISLDTSFMKPADNPQAKKQAGKLSDIGFSLLVGFGALLLAGDNPETAKPSKTASKVVASKQEGKARLLAVAFLALSAIGYFAGVKQAGNEEQLLHTVPLPSCTAIAQGKLKFEEVRVCGR